LFCKKEGWGGGTVPQKKKLKSNTEMGEPEKKKKNTRKTKITPIHELSGGDRQKSPKKPLGGGVEGTRGLGGGFGSLSRRGGGGGGKKMEKKTKPKGRKMNKKNNHNNPWVAVILPTAQKPKIW